MIFYDCVKHACVGFTLGTLVFLCVEFVADNLAREAEPTACVCGVECHCCGCGR